MRTEGRERERGSDESACARYRGATAYAKVLAYKRSRGDRMSIPLPHYSRACFRVCLRAAAGLSMSFDETSAAAKALSLAFPAANSPSVWFMNSFAVLQLLTRARASWNFPVINEVERGGGDDPSFRYTAPATAAAAVD